MGSNTEFRACDSFISTARRSAPARPSAAESPIESTVMMSGAQLGTTGETFAVTLAPAARHHDATDPRLRETTRIPHGLPATRSALPRISFNLVLMTAMIATTIGILVARAVSSEDAEPAAAATAQQAPAARQPHVAVSEKTGADGAVRGKAPHVAPRMSLATMPAIAAASSSTPAAPSIPAAASRKATHAGPSAADIDESLAALAEANRAQSF